MGLLDVLNGMQQGPRGPSDASARSSGGMSPMTMAILGLLAYKAVKHLTGSQPGAAPAPSPAPSPANTGTPGSGMAGGLGDVLKGGLGGLLAGGAAGSVISGGLGDLLKQFQQSGQGDAANSWVSPGRTSKFRPAISRARSAPTRSTRWPRKAACRATKLLAGLSQHLPGVIDHLTPDGRLPTESELSGRI